ncbi:hypothetical protein PV10_06228 [Exophiala mesophila]|uniref:Uncharacterized protein n=1 Tax=Exophiala mesophila TaxID=212818 RepID=A0A0D1WRF5_EXOME|nr:uncharacterized protein PV10_06228 [Exophiala mesophila]KIV91715.1 hypothetical protein PV10_06228 [Exophiala mesophila]
MLQLSSANTPKSVHGSSSSSPDPLASSFHDDNESNIALSRSAPSNRPSSSPSKSSQKPIPIATSFDYNAIPSSPFRTVSEQNLSPWKIRVTVEAEPEEMEDDMDGSTSGMTGGTATMTRTMKIPLRQDSSPTSSRGRASQNTSSDNTRRRTRRSATPVRSARGSSRSRRQSVTDLDVRPLGDDADSDDWTKRTRRKSPSPRKRRTTSRKSGSTSSAAAVDVEHDSSITVEPAGGAKKGSLSTADFEIRPDTDAEDDNGIFHQDNESHASNSPELRHIDLNRVSVRHRAALSKSRTTDEDVVQSLPSGQLNNLQRLSRPSTDTRKVSVNSAISYPTPSPTSSYHGESDDLGQFVDEKEQQQMEVGFDTVLESEGFTMIDLDSIPSARQLRNNLADTVEEIEENRDNRSPQLEPKHDIPNVVVSSSRQQSVLKYPALNLLDESDLSSTVPSSPPPAIQQPSRSLLSAPVITNRKVTPQICPSPELPSPPKQVIRRTPQHAHRGSAGALFAGIALQDVVSPDHPSQLSSVASKDSTRRSQELEGPLFGGFDSGTKRELRAGLRFGEELAKRQSSSPAEKETRDVGVINQVRSKDLPKYQAHQHEKTQPQTQVWRGETTVQQTPVQLPSNPISKDNDFGHPLMQTPDHRTLDTADKSFLDTQARREREWQLEREEIIRQIQNASESQVIVIDSSDDEDEVEQKSSNQGQHVHTSDSETLTDLGAPGPSIENDHENDDYEDIWLAEAKNSSSPQGESHVDRPPGQEILPRKSAQEVEENTVTARPRRSLIPSPWKRGDDIAVPQEQSTFLTSNLDDQSGMLFWKEPDPAKLKFGAGEIRREKQGRNRASGMFDMDIMAGTPRKDGPLYRRISFSSPIKDTNTEDKDEDQDQDQESHENENEIERVSSHHIEHSTISTEGGEESSLDPINNTLGAPEGISSPSPPATRVTVNFNDSMNEMTTPPPRFPAATSTTTMQSPMRPPTPRSAMKGTRLSMAQAQASEEDNSATPLAVRRVIFSERSRGVDVNGMESSFSMKSTTDDSIHDSVAGHLAEQLNRELQGSEPQDHSSAQWDEEDVTEEEGEKMESLGDEEMSEDITPTPIKDVVGREKEAKSQSGWRKWIWGSGSKVEQEQEQKQETIDNQSMSSGADDSRLDDTSGWTRTKTSIPSTANTSKIPSQSSQPSHSRPSPSLPSYLLPPSYPSDPRRSITSPLSTSGSFTNTHFRTLHIIYRKSLRPRFHGPRSIRPCIQALLGKEMEIDETEAGIDRGVMTWTVGEGELEVLERFMQEVEWGYGVGPERRDGRDGRDDGKEVIWGWSPEQLVGWLCRIVVGEVVREEEAKAKPKAKTKARDGRGKGEGKRGEREKEKMKTRA